MMSGATLHFGSEASLPNTDTFYLATSTSRALYTLCKHTIEVLNKIVIAFIWARFIFCSSAELWSCIVGRFVNQARMRGHVHYSRVLKGGEGTHNTPRV